MSYIKYLKEGLLTEASKTLYHGSKYQFDKFDINKVGSGDSLNKFGYGLYFAENPELAAYYANGKYMYEVVIRGIEDFIDWEETISSDLYENVLRLLYKKGLDKDADEMKQDFEDYGDYWSMKSLYEWLTPVLGSTKEVTKFLYMLGVNGVIADDIHDRGKIYVAFSDDIIKMVGLVEEENNIIENLQETISLEDLYSDDNYPAPNEIIWEFVNRRDFKKELNIIKVNPKKLVAVNGENLLTTYKKYATKNQKSIVNHYTKTPFLLKDEIIVIKDNKVIDGNHRVIAAIKANINEIRAVDLNQLYEVEESLKEDNENNQTEAFKKWFGDSKVVDSSGKPLIVYHGTDKKFSKINMKKGAQGVFWFSSNKKSIETGDSGAQSIKVIMSLYARIIKPAGWKEYDKYSIGELQGLGYDGVILKNKDGSFDGFVLEPNQIKSATNNNGNFDRYNLNINENIEEYKNKYPLIKNDKVGELEVINQDDIPNTSSIRSSLTDYYIVKGLREVDMKDFEARPKDLFYAANDFDRAEKLAKAIKQSGQITPLIVVIDKDGPYILEGAHRLAALYIIGAKTFPALVVIDKEDLEEDIGIPGQYDKKIFDKNFVNVNKDWKNGKKNPNA